MKKNPTKRKTKNKGGRPRIYTPEKLDALAESLIDWVSENIASQNKQFLLGDWCFNVGFYPKNFHRYVEQNENFRLAYEWAKQWQEHQIAKGALTDKLNARFAQFFLGCNHKWLIQKDTDTREEKQKSNLEKMSEYLHNEGEDDDDKTE